MQLHLTAIKFSTADESYSSTTAELLALFAQLPERHHITVMGNKQLIASINQAESKYKHVLANILHSRYNTPQYGRNRRAHAAGASILSPCVVCVCALQAVSLADYRWALPRISIVLPQQRNLCTDSKSAQQCRTRGLPLPLPQVTSGSVQQRGQAAADRQTHRRA